MLPLRTVLGPTVKFSVVPDRLLDSISDDALATGMFQRNAFLPQGVSIDLATVVLTMIRKQLHASIAVRPWCTARSGGF